MAAGLRCTINDLESRQAIAEAERRALDLRPALRAMGRAGVNQTRKRFMAGRAPDGSIWKKGYKTSGQTLILSGLLMRSIYATEPEAYAVEWGSNRIYAAIHQFGGVIRAKAGKSLRFVLGGNGRQVFAQKVTIPKRPYLGLSPADIEEHRAILVRHVAQPLTGGPGVE